MSLDARIVAAGSGRRDRLRGWSGTYHLHMSRLFVMFMIVLLPLRGWAGDLMSVQMATSVLASHAGSAMPPDCPMRAQPGAAELDAKASPAPAGTESCTSCDLCIPLAELSDARLDTLSFAAHAKPLMSGVDFISALPAPTLKPPIF